MKNYDKNFIFLLKHIPGEVAVGKHAYVTSALLCSLRLSCDRVACADPPLASPTSGLQVVPTLALYDTMQYVRSKTATVCYGLCLGMGGFLLTTGGEKVCALCAHLLCQCRTQ